MRRIEIPASVRLALTVLLFALPVALYLWFISADGVDMLRADQWFEVSLIQSSLTGHLSFLMLWAQHGDNRIFFQNLVTVLLGHVVHYNVIVEEFINAALIGAMAVVIITHRRRAPRIHWIAYVPVAIVLLSVAQSGDTHSSSSDRLQKLALKRPNGLFPFRVSIHRPNNCKLKSSGNLTYFERL